MTMTERSPRTFSCLPRERYVSDAWLEREFNEVVARQWLYFGHVSQIPEPGDILVRELGRESIILTRDQEGEVHAFYNVCRHRGYRICDGGTGHSKQIVCPYHRWSYDLDGALKGAPTMTDGEDFDFAEYPLKRVAVEIWRGFVFVGLGSKPPQRSLADALTEASPRLDVYAPEQLKLAHQVEYEVACNWKVLLENFLECYHCPGAHPEFCAVSDLSSLYQAAEDITDDFLADEFYWASWPRREGIESFTLTGERACRVALGSATTETGSFSIGILPSLTAIGFGTDYVILQQFMPVETGASRWTAQWLVNSEAVEGRDYEVEHLRAIWHTTNLQDIALCERTQLGINSRSFTPGPNSPKREPMLRSALAVYHRLLAESEEYEALTGEPLEELRPA